MRKNARSQIGITLIALVVTIIVLLIILSITIGHLVGRDGTITQAIDSKTQVELAQLERAVLSSTSRRNTKKEIQLSSIVKEVEKEGYTIEKKASKGNITGVEFSENPVLIENENTESVEFELVREDTKYFAEINGFYFEIVVENGEAKVIKDPVDNIDNLSDTSDETISISIDDTEIAGVEYENTLKAEGKNELTVEGKEVGRTTLNVMADGETVGELIIRVKEKTPDKTKVTITFNANGGTVNPDTTQVTYEENYGTLPTPEKVGYVFDGWYTAINGGTKITSTTKVETTTSQTLYAHWKAGTVAYKVEHWKQNIRPASEEKSSTYYTIVSGDTENKEGTTGTSVSPDVNTYEGFTSPEKQTTTIAANGSTVVKYYYTRNKFKITVPEVEGVTITGIDQDEEYYYGEEITITAVVKEGYEWDKWDDNEESETRKITVTGENLTVIPVVKTTTYTITYDYAGGALEEGVTNPTEFNIGTETITVNNPVETGYDFAGWTGTGITGTQQTLTITKGTTGNKTYVATWTAKIYEVTFNAGEGTVTPATKNVTYNSTYGELPTPTRTGYTFSGWYTALEGGTQVTSETQVAITEAQTLYAHWTVNTYTVTYSGNGSTGGSTGDSTHTYNVAKNLTTNSYTNEKSVTYNHNYEESSNLTRTETFTFNGWTGTINGETTTFDDGQSVINLTSDNASTITLTAIWEWESSYFPTREGYEFDGWYTDAELTTALTQDNLTNNMTVYAKWIKIKPKVGDYISNYPVYYDNVASNGIYYVANEKFANNWRIISIDENTNEVQIVSAGVPLTYYHPSGETAEESQSNLTTQFFNTDMGTTGTTAGYRNNGFMATKSSIYDLSSTSEIKELFNNQYTQTTEMQYTIQSGNGTVETSVTVPAVRAMQQEDIDSVINNGDSSQITEYSDLLTVSSSEGYAYTWLANASGSEMLKVIDGSNGAVSTSGGDVIYGIRTVVTLKLDLEYVWDGEINDTQAWKLQSSDEMLTYYFQKPSDWGTNDRVAAYVWWNGRHSRNADFPGEDIECVNQNLQIYKYTISKSLFEERGIEGIIFANSVDNSSNSRKTMDISVTVNDSGKIFVPELYDPDNSQEIRTISADYEPCYLYAWGTYGNNSAWPGVSQMGNKISNYTYYAILNRSTYPNMIFNNGNGSQTTDLEVPRYQDLTYHHYTWRRMVYFGNLYSYEDWMSVSGDYGTWNSDDNAKFSEAQQALGYL